MGAGIEKEADVECPRCGCNDVSPAGKPGWMKGTSLACNHCGKRWTQRVSWAEMRAAMAPAAVKNKPIGSGNVPELPAGKTGKKKHGQDAHAT